MEILNVNVHPAFSVEESSALAWSVLVIVVGVLLYEKTRKAGYYLQTHSTKAREFIYM